MRTFKSLPENRILRYAVYASQLPSCVATVARLSREPKYLPTIKEKACGLNPDLATRRGVYIPILLRIIFELRTKRLSSLLDKGSLGRMFWSNLRFSQRIKESGLHEELIGNGITIAAVPAKSSDVVVKLRYNKYINIEEGDFILSVEAGGRVVHFMTFSIASGIVGSTDHEAILIGGIQGCQPHLREFRRNVVRDCFDIAPEEVLILAIRGLARKFGYCHLLAVGCEIHSKSFVDSEYEEMRPHLEKSYDMFWLSHGAKRCSKYFLFNPSENPISSEVPKGEHKGRKLKKRDLKRYVLEASQGDWDKEGAQGHQ